MATLHKYEDREDWLRGREGVITGTKFKDIIVKRGTGKKMGYYQLIADRLALPRDEDESPMDRGTRLETEGCSRFAKETGKELDCSLYLITRDDNPSIGYSPDALVVGEKAAYENKCLSSARHIQALLTQEVPDEYEEQSIQPFVVDDELETLYFGFYDPSIGFGHDFFYLTIKREDVAEKVAEYLEYQRRELAEIDEIVNQLTF